MLLMKRTAPKSPTTNAAGESDGRELGRGNSLLCASYIQENVIVIQIPATIQIFKSSRKRLIRLCSYLCMVYTIRTVCIC